MRIKIINTFVLFIALFVITSCSVSPEAAEQNAAQFYEKLKARDYNALKNMLDEEALQMNTWEEWEQIFVQKEALGDLISYEKEIGFEAAYFNERSTISLKYTVKYSTATLYEYIKFIKQGEDYKVITYAYYDSEERRTEMIKKL
jgi:hypothetical protein